MGSCPFCFSYHTGACKKDHRRKQMLVRIEARARQEQVDEGRRRVKEKYDNPERDRKALWDDPIILKGLLLAESGQTFIDDWVKA